MLTYPHIIWWFGGPDQDFLGEYLNSVFTRADAEFIYKKLTRHGN